MRMTRGESKRAASRVRCRFSVPRPRPQIAVASAVALLMLPAPVKAAPEQVWSVGAPDTGASYGALEGWDRLRARTVAAWLQGAGQGALSAAIARSPVAAAPAVGGCPGGGLADSHLSLHSLEYLRLAGESLTGAESPFLGEVEGWSIVGYARPPPEVTNPSFTHV